MGNSLIELLNLLDSYVSSLKENVEAALIEMGIDASGASPQDYGELIKMIQTGITPTGTLEITENGEYDVTNFALAIINVPTTSESEGSIEITSNGTHNVEGLKEVIVNITQTVEAGANDGLIDNSLSNFVMPTGKTTIYKYAFYYKSNLKNVDITGVTSIGDYAFRYSGITSIVIPSTVSMVGSYVLADCTSLKNIVINNNTLASYQFYNDTALEIVTVADGLSVKSIPSYCFQNCKSLKSFPFTKFTTFNDYAFYYAGYNNSSDDAMELVLDGVNIMSYAFAYANIKKIDINLNNNYIRNYIFDYAKNTESIKMTNWKTSTSSSYGQYAFRNNTAKIIDMSNVESYYKNYMFDNCVKVEELIGVKPIGTIYDYCFRGLGSQRESNGRLIIDLSESTFTTINQYAFANLVETDLILPSTVTTINSNAFNGCTGLHLFLASSPTLSNVSAFASNKDLIIFTEFGNISSLASKTNWNTYSGNIFGYRLGFDFEDGIFPSFTPDGSVDVLWYTDMTLTTIATEIDNNNTYYCILGPKYLKTATGLNCSINVQDTDGNSYSLNDQIYLGKKINITFIPDEGQEIPYQIKLNGAVYDLTDFDNQINGIVIEDDLNIVAIYWDGITVPYNPVFGENSWDLIKLGIESRVGFELGWKIGDTKTITTSDGNTYTLRICDTIEGRYTKSDGTPTNAVIEFVEGLPNKMQMNYSVKEGYWAGGGWAECDMNKTKLPEFMATLPADLQEVISEVQLTGYSYSGTNPRTGTSKLFLPNTWEVFGNDPYGYEGSANSKTRFEYYTQINNLSTLQKYRLGSTSSEWFWLRSAYYNYSFYVWRGTSYNSNSANISCGVAPVFAI